MPFVTLTGHIRRRPGCRPGRVTTPLGALTPLCATCRVPLDQAEALRVQLHDLSESRRLADAVRERSMAAIRPLLQAAQRSGISPTELVHITGLSLLEIHHLTRGERVNPSVRG